MLNKNETKDYSICQTCGESRYRAPAGNWYCKTCSSNRYKRYMETTTEEEKERKRRKGREYWARTIDKQKEYYQNNKDKRISYQVMYRKEKRHSLYPIWMGLKQRCFNPNSKDYLKYGGRGVSVYDGWISRGGSAKFIEYIEKHLGPRPGPEYSLDRIDNNGDYEPGNVKWSTRKEQANNRRSTRSVKLSIPENSPITYPFDCLITLKEFSEQTGLPLIICQYRYAQNPSADWILHDEWSNRYYEYKGFKYKIDELSLLTGIDYQILYRNIVTRSRDVNQTIEAFTSSIE